MDEQEFLRQVTAAPELKKGYVVGNCPDGISAKCETTDGRLLRCVSETATMRWFVGVDGSDHRVVGRKGVGKTLREAIKDLNKRLPSSGQILHPAAKEFQPDATEIEKIQWLRDIAESMADPHWQNYPVDSEEFKNGQRAAVLAEVFDGMVEASRAALLKRVEMYPQYSDALESLRYNSGKTYRLLFGEDLP